MLGSLHVSADSHLARRELLARREGAGLGLVTAAARQGWLHAAPPGATAATALTTVLLAETPQSDTKATASQNTLRAKQRPLQLKLVHTAATALEPPEKKDGQGHVRFTTRHPCLWRTRR